MKTTKLFFMAALALMTAACSNDENDLTAPQPQKAEGITITAQLAPKTSGTTTRAVSDGGNKIESVWAENEHIAVLYEVSSTKYVADATITAVDGSGTATIEFTVESGTADNTECTLVYPLSAAKTDKTGVKDAATLLASQNGTLNANLDVRVGAGKIQITTPSLDVTTQPAAQFAIFKFTTKDMAGSSTVNVKSLTITVGADSYVITPSTATSTLYAALPATTSGTITFNATDGDSKKHFFSKNGVTIEKGKFYQSTIKLISYSTPLTMEALTDGTIVITSPKNGMQFSLNSGKMAINPEADGDGDNTKFTINVNAGEKMAFYGDGTNITNYYGTKITDGTAQVKVYGNIMSLVDETGYETATALLAENTFDSFFDSNANLTDASGLLLPATTLSSRCYSFLFNGCAALTAAPALPATSLASYCYSAMFNNCVALTAAPALPAKVLSQRCYQNMFKGCTKLSSVTCLATDISANNCLFNWLQSAGTGATNPTLYVDASMTGATWNNGSFTVTAKP